MFLLCFINVVRVLVCLCCVLLSVSCSLVVTCLEKTDLLALLCVVSSLVLCHYPIFVLIHISTKGEAVAVKHVKSIQ